jgi:hypothetical protein
MELRGAVLLLSCAGCAVPTRAVVGGLVLDAPAGWRRVDPGQVERFTERPQPGIRRLHRLTRASPPLALFLAPAPAGAFWSNLSVREAKVALAPESALAPYRRRLVESLQETPSDIRKVTVTYCGRQKVLKAEWTYGLARAGIYAVQVLYPWQDRTYVLTYRFPAKRLLAERVAVDASIRSLRPRSSQGPRRPGWRYVPVQLPLRRRF